MKADIILNWIRLFKQYDIQNRPVVHPWQLFGGIETQHYREYNYGIGNYENGQRDRNANRIFAWTI